MPDNSVPPLWPWFILSCFPSAGAQSEWVWDKFVHKPFKINCLGLQQPLSHSATIPAGFYSQKLWRFPFLALETWAGSRCGVGSFRRDLCTWDIPSNFYPHTRCGTSSFYQFQCDFFFKDLVLGFHSVDFRCFWVIVVILMRLWEDVSTTLSMLHLD